MCRREHRAGRAASISLDQVQGHCQPVNNTQIVNHTENKYGTKEKIDNPVVSYNICTDWLFDVFMAIFKAYLAIF